MNKHFLFFLLLLTCLIINFKSVYRQIATMTKEFKYSFSELGITAIDIEELMGFEEGNLPEPFPVLIQQALIDVTSVCNIKGGFKIFNSIELSKEKQTIKIEKHEFNPSDIIIKQFKNARSISLFICTAGPEISEHAKQLALNGDPLLSYVFDVIGSLTVEKAMDKIQKTLENEVQLKGMNISDRFSPGYCDWSVSEQQMLFDLMPKNFCGVTLSESSLMAPIKSVSGMIAIGESVSQKGYQCFWCSDQKCVYGKINRKKKIKKKP